MESRQLNPFQPQHAPPPDPRGPSQALVAVEQDRAVAETQAALAIAKRFPRDQLLATDRILTACGRQTLAEQALYSYARGGTEITGPSIRLAEAIAQQWGNIQFGIRELEQRGGESTVEAFAWDVETNTRQTKVFQIPHKRHTRKGAYALEDPRDIYELVANQGARRLRACILGVIPGDVVEAAVEQCEETMRQNVQVTPQTIQSMVEAFARYGVTKKAIETRIQRRIDAMTPGLMAQLRKIYNSLKDGMSVPGDWFDVAPAADTGQGSGGLDGLVHKSRQTNEAPRPEGFAGAPDGEEPREPAVSPQPGLDETPKAPSTPKPEVRRRMQGPYSVPEDIQEHLEGVTSLPSAGILPETMWSLYRLGVADRDNATTIKSYLAERNISNPVLSCLREEEGQELLAKLEGAYEARDARESTPENLTLPQEPGEASAPESLVGRIHGAFEGENGVVEIECPNTGQGVPPEKCEGCVMGEGCPSWDPVK